MAFHDAYLAWRAAPFPQGSEDEQLDDIHAELAYLDALVADLVVPIVESDRRTSSTLDVALLAANLIDRITRQEELAPADLRGRLVEYREYCGLLLTVYELAPKGA